MLKYILTVVCLLQVTSLQALANEAQQLQAKVAKTLPGMMLQNIKDNYAYADQKNINWACLNKQYTAKINHLNDRSDTVLFFEHLLLEFHMTLNTNIQDSYRLNSPLIVNQEKGAFIIDDYWQNQLLDSGDLVTGAKLMNINGITPEQVIKNFPTLCQDKTQVNNQQWIINKALAGQYSQPRIIELSVGGVRKTIDLDRLRYLETKRTLSIEKKGKFGVIKINNSLGKIELIQAFDQALDSFSSTQGLVLDLRNTISGGDSYIARAIIGRFIEQDQPYQKHRFEEHREGGPKVPRFWTEYVAPRSSTYKKPLVVLVNRWTGSMGEGLAIGLHGMQRAHVIGTPMAELLGAVYGYPLEDFGFGYQMPAEQLFHVDGTPRESFIPDTLVKPNAKHSDAVLAQGIQWLQQQNETKK